MHWNICCLLALTFLLVGLLHVSYVWGKQGNKEVNIDHYSQGVWVWLHCQFFRCWFTTLAKDSYLFGAITG